MSEEKKKADKETLHSAEGRVSVDSENLFPIIRKWLYSDRDIFLRELVSNAADAIQKYERLGQLGEVELEKESGSFEIHVSLDSEQGLLTVEDQGLGMSREEIEKYINRIAFSGALDFISQYEEKGETGAGIIGHFGLGFYSAFMVSKQVEIFSKSYREGSVTVHWSSEDGIHFTLGEAAPEQALQEHGTKIVLHLDDENRGDIDASFTKRTLEKYCSFMKDPIYFRDLRGEAEAETARLERLAEAGEKLSRAESEEEKKKAQEELDRAAAPLPPRAPLNHPSPLWLKAPKECSEEEYKEFYKLCFHDPREPLFQIHLNMDYPFKLKGILYFPQREERVESLDGRIKLFYNRVFVADQLKDLIPDFLFLLRGVMDCPDLPLNVSRSFLQNDSYLKKLSEHIVRKVADRLLEIFRKDRPRYEKVFEDIKLFVRYGCMTNEKFMEKMKEALLFKTREGSYLPLAELNEKVYYCEDLEHQLIYAKQHEAAGEQVILMDHEIDHPFMQQLSHKNEGKPRFLRVDAELPGAETSLEEKEKIESLFRKVSGKEGLSLESKALGAEQLPALLLEDQYAREFFEFQKRMAAQNPEMAASLAAMTPDRKLLLNTEHGLVKKLLVLIKEEDAAAETTARMIYKMASLSHGSMNAEELEVFLHELAGQML